MDVRIALLALFSCLLMASPASAQALQVLDGTSRQPVIGAVLSSKAPARQAATDSTGSVGLAGFPDSALVRVEHISYEPLRIRASALRKLDGPLLLWPRTTELDAFVFSASRFKEPRRDVPEGGCGPLMDPTLRRRHHHAEAARQPYRQRHRRDRHQG